MSERDDLPFPEYREWDVLMNVIKETRLDLDFAHGAAVVSGNTALGERMVQSANRLTLVLKANGVE